MASADTPDSLSSLDASILDGLAPPEHPLSVEHRGQLIFLLREAAELEHGIMCQYLFAAYSMKRSTSETASSSPTSSVKRV